MTGTPRGGVSSRLKKSENTPPAAPSTRATVSIAILTLYWSSEVPRLDQWHSAIGSTLQIFVVIASLQCVADAGVRTRTWLSRRIKLDGEITVRTGKAPR